MDDTAVLKKNITEYLSIDNDINQLKQRVKKLTERKKRYEGQIISFMKNQNISDINSANSRIKFNSSLRKENLSKRVIQEQVTKYFENDKRFQNLDIEQEVQQLITFVYKNREKNVLNENLVIKNLK